MDRSTQCHCHETSGNRRTTGFSHNVRSRVCRSGKVKRLNLPSFFATAILFACVLTDQADEPIRLHPDNPRARKPPAELAEFFAPPEQYRSDVGNFLSPLVFAD